MTDQLMLVSQTPVFDVAWDDDTWLQIDPPPPPGQGLIPAGSGNDLQVPGYLGGTMSGDVSADAITVDTPPVTGSITFADGSVTTDFFELVAGGGPQPLLTLSDASLEATATLIVGQGATLDVGAGSLLTGPSSATPGLSDQGAIVVNGGSVTSTELNVYGSFDLASGTGTFGTLAVGSYTGPGGFGGAGLLTIDSGGSINVTNELAVAVQTGTATIDINGGTLTDAGDADVGYEDAGTLSLTAGGSMSVTGTFDAGTASSGTGTVSIDGDGSTLSVGGQLIVGDAGSGSATVSDGASVSFDEALIVGNTGSGTLTVTGGAVVGAAGQGTIEIGVSVGATGGIGVSGAGSSLNGQVLAVGGSGASPGGVGNLSIGSGDNVDVTSATIWDSGAVVLSGGDLIASPITVDGAVSGYGTLSGNVIDNGAVTVTGGMLTVTGVVGGGGTLAFGGVATLVLGAPGTTEVAQAVTGLANGDRIELAGLSIASAAVSSPGTITVVTPATGGGVFRFTDVTFANGASHTLITGQDATTGDDYIQVACYAAGTHILTDRGEVRVEDLRAGDRVVSAFGGSVPVVWLGHRHVDCRRHPRSHDVWPVRVREDAFGPGLPRRDLLLSPDHAVYVDDVLIPVRYLINGATIVQEPVAAVTYWHVELPAHDVMLAEGLPAESYLDTGNRSSFANGGPATALHPDFALGTWDSHGCAPLVLDGGVLAVARGRLLERAAVLGHALTRDAALHLIVDGRAVHGEVEGCRHRFRLPAQASGVRLMSRSAVPAETGIADADARRLGIAVAALALDGVPVGLDDARLGAGWHAVELRDGTGATLDLRWTDGDGALAITDGRVLEVDIALTARYWLEPHRSSVWLTPGRTYPYRYQFG